MRTIFFIIAFVCLFSFARTAHGQTSGKSATYSHLKIPAYKTTILGKPHTIYWTIDDHPTSSTHKVLDLLKKYQIKATFFVVAYVLYAHYRSPKWPVLLSRKRAAIRMVKEGHTVGNHSFTHGRLCRMTKAKVFREVRLTQKYIKKVTGVTPKHWRPPHGSRCSYTRRAARKYKLTTVMWHIDDYRQSAKYIWFRIQRRVRRGYKETIVLVHTNPKKIERLFQLMKLPTIKTPPPRLTPRPATTPVKPGP